MDFKWLTDFLGNGTQMQGAGTLLGGIGNGFGMIQQSKAAKDLLNLQKDAYTEDKKRRDRTQLALDNAFNTVPNTIAKLPLGGG